MLITGRTTIAAGKRSENVVAGSSFEFVEQASLIQMAGIVTVPDYYDIQMLFNLGGVNFSEPSFAMIFPLMVTQVGTVAEGLGLQLNSDGIPNNLYHNYIYAGASPSDRIFMEFINQGTSAAAVNWLIRIDPV